MEEKISNQEKVNADKYLTIAVFILPAIGPDMLAIGAMVMEKAA